MDDTAAKPICGIVMPISAIDGCSETHWTDVHQILSESIATAGFTPNLVSSADDIGVIQKRIVQNLYDNPIVVCDVSGKNPNVMFELGMRLAFDKPTIIVKDDKTSYSFDTSIIEHLEYPRDLRFGKIIEFKNNLSSKIKFTHEKSRNDGGFSTFLKHFGEFKLSKIDQKEVSSEAYILEELKEIRSRIDSSWPTLSRRTSTSDHTRRKLRKNSDGTFDLDYCLRNTSPDDARTLASLLDNIDGVISTEIKEISPSHTHLVIRSKTDTQATADSIIQDFIRFR